ncbi:MAG: PHP domain-containing protein, partial [Myxococcaceae bacterium]|nr:PHP domain-containing protein [Myxococcaceae bacterium]
TASDGQHAPSTLVAMAAGAGVTTLAVTDHDTVAGLAEAAEAARAHGMTLVPGIELSAFLDRREVHLLGHFIDPSHLPLRALSARLRTEREERMERMVERLRSLGFPVTMADVRKVAGDAQLGRPHLARVLVERGWCASTREAFDRFLGHGQGAFVERARLGHEEAIRMLREAGGTATLAHPGSSKMEAYDIGRLAAAGLAGLEVLHPDHNPSVREKYLRIARAHDLVPTAGSDFHGEAVSPDSRLGTANMAPQALASLRARAGR